MDAHKQNNEAVKQPKSCGKGYMGQVHFCMITSKMRMRTIMVSGGLRQLRLLANLVQKQKALDTWMEEFTSQAHWKARSISSTSGR